jgi:hypothetical protein
VGVFRVSTRTWNCQRHVGPVHCILNDDITIYTLLPINGERHARLVLLSGITNIGDISMSTYRCAIDRDQHLELGRWTRTDTHNDQGSWIRPTNIRELYRKLFPQSDSVPTILLFSKKYGSIHCQSTIQTEEDKA